MPMGTTKIVSEIIDSFIKKIERQKDFDSKFVQEIKECITSESKVTVTKLERILYEESGDL